MRHLVAGFMGSLLLVAGACGGKVVVESTGATGAGGAGGATTTDTGNGGFINSTGDVSPVGVVSAVSTGTGGVTLCEQLCADQIAKGCDQGPDCVASCNDAYANIGMCKPQLDNLLQCILATSDTLCSNPVACAGQVQSYTNCMQPTMMCTGATTCSVTNDGSCDCQTDCNGSKLEVQCQPGNATDFCLCIKDGKPLDKCPQPQGSGLSCDIEQGCCAKVFFP